MGKAIKKKHLLALKMEPVLESGRTNRLLGYPPDARLLIINADDFGMCHSVNEAIIMTLKAGVIRSTTMMVPCPGAKNAGYRTVFRSSTAGVILGVGQVAPTPR